MSIVYQRYPELTTRQRNHLFSTYAPNRGAFLFDSGHDGGNHKHKDSRFDILAVEPLEIFSGKDLLDDDPLNTMSVMFKTQLTDKIPEQLAYLPCIGGLFFALSYDLGKYYEKLTDHSENDLQLADYFAASFGCIFIIDRKLHCSYLICSDDRSNNSYEQLAARIQSVLEHDEDSKPCFTLLSEWQANFNPAEYAKAFAQIQSYIQSGDCYQINLAQRFNAKCSGSSWHAYCQLSEANQAPFSAFINIGEADILSLSPERFIQLNQMQVETRPIKGTRPRGNTAAQDQKLQQQLSESTKDQAENLMIVDLMRNDLGRCCVPGSIKVPELFGLESFQSVHHLVSTIHGQLEKGEDAFSLLANCFPGGSITGTPKIRAMNIIDQLEPHRRSYYCGSIGYIDIRGNMDSNISIRTLIRKEQQLYCWAGGGIVSESEQQLEYQETFDKVSRILPVLRQKY